jgi:hypothetical protein
MSEAQETKLGATGVNDKKTPLDAVQEGEATVTCEVPRGFTITLDDHTKVEVKAGVQELGVVIANHWYAKAHGVKIYAPAAAAKEEPEQTGEETDPQSDAPDAPEKRRPGRPPKAAQ